VVLHACYVQLKQQYKYMCKLKQQQAQLSHRDHETLPVIEYIAKSLKVIRNDTDEYGVCKSLLVFRWNYVSRTVSEIFNIK